MIDNNNVTIDDNHVMTDDRFYVKIDDDHAMISMRQWLVTCLICFREWFVLFKFLDHIISIAY